MKESKRTYKHLFGLTKLDFKRRMFKKLKYEPNSFQKKVHASIATIRVGAGAARVGKTYCAVFEIVSRMHYLIPQTIWCVAPTYELARKVFREVWDYVHTEEGKKLFPLRIKQFDKMKMVFWNGTSIEGKSTDNPQSLLGEGVDFMVCDEASRIPQEIYSRYLLTRLLTNKGELLLISTPNGKNNAFHEFYLQGQDPDNKLVESWVGTIYDNELIDKEALEYIESKKHIDPIGYKQEVLGEFVSHDGDVFPSFEKDVFFGKVPFNPNLEVMASIDHGFSNPFCCLFLQRNGRQLRCIQEYYVAGKGDIEHVEVLKPIFKKFKIKRCVVDPREPNTKSTFAKLIPECKFIAGPAKEIALGINIIRDHLQEEDGRPLFLADKTNCAKLMWEFQKAHYKKGDSEEIVDKDNHALSCLRYFMLTYCNFLKRTDLSYFSSMEKDAESFTSIYSGESSSVYTDRSIWMGNEE